MEKEPNDIEQAKRDDVNSDEPDQTLESPIISEKPKFSVYSVHEKWIIVGMASVAGIFSPLTANIYLPAIPTLVNAFHKSIEDINLTVTMYMVFQGLSPVVWGPLADLYGRRPIYLACLLLLVLSCIGLALVPTKAYWLLLFLRMFQAAGSASTIALGSGTIVDIALPSERAGFLGLFTLGPMFGPCVGPLLGGVLADRLGWRAIFWFMCIMTGGCLLFIFLLFPETLRTIVGDGSIRAPAWNRPVFRILGRNHPQTDPPKSTGGHHKPQNPFVLFTHPDVVVVLAGNALPYCLFYGITVTMSSLFAQSYPFLTESDLGYVFLALGGGLIVGSVSNGKISDAIYRRHKRAWDDQQNRLRAEGNAELSRPDHEFPIEKVRLSLYPFYLTVFLACSLPYGWVVEKRVNLSVPLILQFFVGWTGIATMNAWQTVLMDLFPKQGSSITAVNNLVRCTSAAILVAIINIIIDALHPGWTYILLSAICALSYLLCFVEIRMGARWREKRRLRVEKRNAEEKEKEAHSQNSPISKA